MKKYLIIAVVIMSFISVAPVASACDISNPCGGNGPIVAQKFGGRFLKAGQEDCPSWFPSFGGNSCYTMRSFGAYFIPLN